MAAVLDALVPYVLQMVKDIPAHELRNKKLLLGEIVKLEGKVRSMGPYLAEAERRRIHDAAVQRWVNKLKDALYEAADVLELCQLGASDRREQRRRRGRRSSWDEEKVPEAYYCLELLLLCVPTFAHGGMGGRIRELNMRLDDIREEMVHFGFIELAAPYYGVVNDEIMPPPLLLDKSAVVVGKAIQEDTTALVRVLLSSDEHDLMVVSITGPGGIGKTTLAKNIVNDMAIEAAFMTRIWLSITESYDPEKLLRSAIAQTAGGEEEFPPRGDQQVLSLILAQALSSAGKFLLVLDGASSDRPWAHVLQIPVVLAQQRHPGSRVIVTTRNQHLVKGMGASYHQHRVEPLCEEDAWALLEKQSLPQQVVGTHLIEDIGLKIIKSCNGLPLAIKVVGGLLSTRKDHGESVLHNLVASSVVGLPQEVENWLYLSYDDLSPQLKQCFLYCSLFPKGEEIIGDVITQMWISEGFIQPPDAATSSTSSHEHGLEDIATQFYRELIQRNLIEPITMTGNRCTMHDVIRSFAQYMAREESLVVVDGRQASHPIGGGYSAQRVRRVSVGGAAAAVEWAVLQSKRSLRTLIVNCSSISFPPAGGPFSLGTFSSLRVLYICSADSGRLVESLSELKHLRYLHLENTDVSGLPDDIHRMKFLLCITLACCKRLGNLPSSTVNLVQLRCLDITASSVNTVPKGFGGLTSLRSLHGFPVGVDAGNSWCSLQELEPLSHLRELTLVGLEKVPDSWMAKRAMISRKTHLTYLDLSYTTGDHSCREMIGPGGEVEQQQQQSVIGEEVIENLCPPSSLENLTIQGGYVGRKLPNWMHAPASAGLLKSLRHLMLEDLSFCTQLPDGLCCLPCLELLNIQHAPVVKRIGPEFQATSSLAAAVLVSFPKLTRLHLADLCEWEEWEWNNSCCDEELGGVRAAIVDMPCLEKLLIKNCKLRRLPPGLANSQRHALRELYLYQLTYLTSVENLPSVVEFGVFDCPSLNKISGLSMLHSIRIIRCPNLDVLEGVPALHSLRLNDTDMETLPPYLQDVSPRCLFLSCSEELYGSVSSPGSSEWNKISHIGKHVISYYQYD